MTKFENKFPRDMTYGLQGTKKIDKFFILFSARGRNNFYICIYYCLQWAKIEIRNFFFTIACKGPKLKINFHTIACKGLKKMNLLYLGGPSIEQYVNYRPRTRDINSGQKTPGANDTHNHSPRTLAFIKLVFIIISACDVINFSAFRSASKALERKLLNSSLLFL